MANNRGSSRIGGQLAAHLGNLLDLIKLIHGSGSGIDADMVDQRHVDDTKTDTSSLWTSSKVSTQLGLKIDGANAVTNATANKLLYLDSNAKLPTSITGNADGNAATATKLATARTISISTDATGSVSFDGTANATLALTLANSGVTAGTYTKVTVDSKGRVTTATTLASSDIPALDWSKITTGKPTTLNGYGITDGVNTSGGTINGNLNINGTTDTNILSINGYTIMSAQTSHPEIGSSMVNPLATAFRLSGKKLYQDEEFASSSNAVTIYNTSGGGGVTVSRTTLATAPNTSNIVLQFTHNGSTTNPGLGGFVQQINAKLNGIFAQVFKAKIPIGYTLNATSIALGNNSTEYWLTNNTGTGKWETYVRITICGNGGSFSSGGNVYLTGTPAPTAGSPLIWYLASCTTYDLTDTNLGSGSLFDSDTVDGKDVDDAKTDTSSLWTASKIISQLSLKVDNTNTVTTATANKLLYLDSNAKLPASITGNADGNAATANKLVTARTIGLSADASGSVSFDGSANATLAVTLANSGVTAGTYTKVTVDSKGRTTSGTTLVATDIPVLDWSKITTGKPTTVSGYGITDAYTKSDVDILTQRIIDYSQAYYTASGGGTITLDVSYNIKWTSPIRLQPMDKANASDSFISLLMPANATVISGIGACPSVTVTSSGIPLTGPSTWLALYAKHNVGGINTAITYYVADYSTMISGGIDSNYILVAIRNGDNNNVKLCTGFTLNAGDSVTNGKISTSAIYNLDTILTGKSSTTHTHNITVSGDISGSVTIDNTVDTLSLSLPSITTAGTYTKMTVNAKGQITSSTTLTATDIPSLDWSKITTGKPTTLNDYGITDGKNINGTGFYKTSNTGSTYVDQYTLIASINLSAQAKFANLSVMLMGGNSGTTLINKAIVDVRIRQQAVMASPPVYELKLMESSGAYTASDFNCIIMQNDASLTIVNLYVKVHYAYETLTISPLVNFNNDNVTFYNSSPFLSALPSGIGAGSLITCTDYSLTYHKSVVATSSSIGHVQIGDGISVDANGVISATIDGTSIIMTGTSPNKIISHADTSNQSSITNTGSAVIQSVSVDGMGHVISMTSKTLSATDVRALPISGGDMSGNVNFGIYSIQFNANTNNGTAGAGATDYSLIYAEHDSGTENSRLVLEIQDNTTDAIVLRTNSRSTPKNSISVSYDKINFADIPYYGTYKFWTAGNMGSGSGLNSDLLDGLESTAFSLTSHTHPIATPLANGSMSFIDKSKLDGIYSEVNIQTSSASSSSWSLGNSDWTSLLYTTDMSSNIGSNCIYSASDRGVKITAQQYTVINIPVSVDPNATYRITIRTTKKSGDGKIYAGVTSYDNDMTTVISTDQASYNNYGIAFALTPSIGISNVYTGTFSGYNATTDSNNNKFDPEAKYFRVMLLVNYGCTLNPSETIIESVECYKVPNLFNASSSDSLSTSRTFSISGDGTASAVSFDGTSNVALALTLSNSGVTAGTYTKVTVDSKGRTTSGTTLSASDIPALDWSKITTGKPTTLSGYGITDGVNVSSAVTTATANKLLYLDASGYLPTSITGNAATATKLATTRTITASGDMTGSVSFDGSSNVTLNLVSTNQDYKTSVRVASKSNVTLTGDVQAGSTNYIIDGVTLSNGDRVLLKDQTDGKQNGMYTVALSSTNNIYEVASLTITAAATATGTVTITLNGTAFNVSVTTGDSTTTIATNIRGTAMSGWTLGGSGSIITFTATSYENKTDATYSAASTGATGTMATTSQGSSATATAVYTRSTDADASSEFSTSFLVFVDEGTNYADSGWVLSNNGAITLGTTVLSFTQVASPIVTTATANKILKLDSSGNLPTSITGNAATATKLATTRTISLSGGATGSASFDGSANATIAVTVTNDSHTHSNYTPFTTVTGTAFGGSWTRIAQSPTNVGANSGMFKIDFTGTSNSSSTYRGRALVIASCHDAIPSGSNINQIGYANSIIGSGIIKARVIYKSTNAYVEIWNASTADASINVDIIDSTGWTLLSSFTNTGTTVPSGYTSEELTLDVGIISGEDITTSKQLISNATSVAPLVVNSTIMVNNLNAQYINGKASTDILLRDGSQAMTSALTLSGDPTSALHAVTKQYVDNTIVKLADNAWTQYTPIDKFPAGVSYFGTTSTGFIVHGAVETFRGIGSDSSYSYQVLVPNSSVGTALVYKRNAITTSKTLWVASHAYALNDIIQPTTSKENGHYYKCTTAGTSGTTEPTWNMTTGSTTTSGTAVFTETGSFWTIWDTPLVSSNMGHGSLINADVLDGLEATDFVNQATTKKITLGTAVWSKNNGETNILGEIIDSSATGDSRLMIYSLNGNTNVYVDGKVYVDAGVNRLVSTADMVWNTIGGTRTSDMSFQPSVSGGNVGILFNSKVNSSNDYGYIRYYDDNDNYNYYGDSNNNSALVIGSEKDGLTSTSDVVVLKAGGGTGAVIIDSAKLRVNGDINIQGKFEIQYNATNNSLDFVYVG